MNNINDRGAKHLALALTSGIQPFTKLRIRNCNITEIGGLDIAKSLRRDQGLNTLDIDNNPLNMKVANELHAVLKTNFNIAHLSTENCNFSEKMTEFLRTVVYHNRHKKRFKLNYVDVENLDEETEYESVFEEELPLK